MNGPLTVKTHLRGRTSIVFALLQIAKLKRDTIYNIDSGGPRGSHYMGFWVVIKRKLLAHRITCADAAGVIHHAKNQASQAWGRYRNLLGTQNAFRALD